MSQIIGRVGLAIAGSAALSPVAGDAGAAATAAEHAPLLLPGFAPIRTDGDAVILGAGRRYTWNQSLLPTTLEARGRVVGGPLHLAVWSEGRRVDAASEKIDFGYEGADRVERRATGRVLGELVVTATANVEYDGLAVVDVVLTPDRPVRVDRVELRLQVPRGVAERVLGWDARSAYWSNQQGRASTCSRDGYRSILAFLAHDTGLWWLADETDEALVGAAPVTEIRCSADMLELIQPVVTGSRLLSDPIHYRFALLATPIREPGSVFWSHRPMATAVPAEARVANLGLWWISATAHYALPFLDYPLGARGKIDPRDLRAYPGVKDNRLDLQRWRALGVERLPYMSLRAISPLDDEAQEHLGDWVVAPARYTGQEVDAPYVTAYRRPLVSLRAGGFVEHQLERLGEITDGLGVSGFYFDQAEPIGSSNPRHVPVGAAGNAVTATDVLAMREFFRRLAMMLVTKGKTPAIYVHNSTAPIIPAYTFVTGMVQGEELNATLQDFDYQSTLPPDYVWSMFGAQHSGVPTVWLEELWSEALASNRPPRFRQDTRGWLASPEYYRAWRNFMALALLHDIPVWSQAPLRYRETLYRRLADFGIANGEFVGYWRLLPTQRQDAVRISAYVRADNSSVLAVVANMTAEPRPVFPEDVGSVLEHAMSSDALRAVRARYLATAKPVVVPGRDFELVELR